MACGCAGSTARQAATREAGGGRARDRQQQVRRPGGPGQPGYTWNGPQQRPPRQPSPAPAE
jgi:hypothetical protein